MVGWPTSQGCETEKKATGLYRWKWILFYPFQLKKLIQHLFRSLIHTKVHGWIEIILLFILLFLSFFDVIPIEEWFGSSGPLVLHKAHVTLNLIPYIYINIYTLKLMTYYIAPHYDQVVTFLWKLDRLVELLQGSFIYYTCIYITISKVYKLFICSQL